MTVDQNQPQGIQQFDTTDSGSDLIIDAPSTPDLRPVKLILLAMILGITVGLLFGTRAVVFGPIGSTIIGMIKTLAGPLILFAVLEAFLKTEMTWKQAWRMISVAAINGACAVVIGLTLANVIQPGVGWKPSADLKSAASTTIKPASRKIEPGPQVGGTRCQVRPTASCWLGSAPQFKHPAQSPMHRYGRPLRSSRARLKTPWPAR